MTNDLSKNFRAWSMLGQRGTFFGIAMPEIAAKKDNLKLLTADLSLLSGMTRFIDSYPDKFLNVGIAEQNMIGIAAGLAMSGKCVFASTYSSFIAVRCLEHVRQHLSYLKCNVKIIGTSAGCIAAKSGVSHWATEDIAFIRALPNMIVLSPADAAEAYKMAFLAADIDDPVYIRISGGLNCPMVHKEDFDLKIGKALQLKEGKDIAIIATGLMVSNSLKAAEKLKEEGISAAVFDFHTIKPLDKELLDKIFSSFKMIVTVEEHNVIGGLGGAVAEYKATKSNAPKQEFIGFQDSFAQAGGQQFIWDAVGLTEDKIAGRILREWNND